jgi:superfamily II DNA or RNA helicase
MEYKIMTGRNKIALHPFQCNDVETLLNRLSTRKTCRLLYQLPTGGGKTVIFSELAKRYSESSELNVLVLTHRIELCTQTVSMMERCGLKAKMINSGVKKIPRKPRYRCFVAMVETLKNRIKDGLIDCQNIGMVIVDEAHHNSFRKLLNKFDRASIIGVTATPLSSDINLPLHKSYDELITGMDIGTMIREGVLAAPVTHSYDVELNTLQTGIRGDFTVGTSDELYGTPAMLGLLEHAFKTHAKGKKTLIFNNGVLSSRLVCQHLSDAGYPVKHLDHKTPPAERKEILSWFKKTKDAILTSVSLLTTGFDEPTIKAVILNRATTSLTLYHQMIGRGSRALPGKKRFSIIDLGNNADRFGQWQDPLDWNAVFNHPEEYSYAGSHTAELHVMPSEQRSKFANSLEIAFDVQAAYSEAVSLQLKPKVVISKSLRQHALICMDNAKTIVEALALSRELDGEIKWRIKQYCKCLGNVTKSYSAWLEADYKEKLEKLISKFMQRHAKLAEAV